MAMDVDEDEDATQRPKAAADFGIQVDFSSIEDPEEPATALARLDKEISDKAAEIERMAPNIKAMERFVASCHADEVLMFCYRT